MDTTIRNLDETIYRELKAHAALTGKTIGETVNEAVRLFLTQIASTTEHREPIRLKTFTGRGVRAGVDLNRSADLLDSMEE